MERTRINRPSGETDFWASDDDDWIRYDALPRTDFYLPSGEQGAPRTPQFLPFLVVHVDSVSGDDSNDEPFDFSTEDFDVQHPSDYITPKVGRPWTGFTTFFRNLGHTMEKKGRYDEGRSLPDETGPSGHAHKAKPLPSPSGPSKSEIEAHNLAHQSCRRWCSVCVRAKGKESPHTSTSERLPVILMGVAFLGARENRDKSVTVITAIDPRAQMSVAVALPTKSANRHALTLKRFIRGAGGAMQFFRLTMSLPTRHLRELALPRPGHPQ